jgi:Holliday junction DNA helicase RuvA
MIARLHGRVVALEADAVILDVGGVGYRVHVPAQMLAELAGEGTSVTLYTHLHVRENEMALYGAADEGTVALFRMLLGVSGIGPRLALAMLSTADAPTLRQAIVADDVDLLVQVPGVGKKTAQRILLDLKSPLERLGVVAGEAAPSLGTEDAEAVAALTGLGYSTGEARQALAAADVDAGADLEDRVLAALRVLARA